ncbi:MAG: bifunctional (p)ppGpp synthetase/guanosine-3',5'-bis(diphosphate) 3'-pyrophosphohydrolase [Alphaproteobacteria bacterium]|nr:bifunctional (p)ppGpp synthetase/guanosine-3',5'-bis(diphosphate) 3'-pyrophosphohydrolase [Alphaproteobacteria bacterium]
MNYDNVTQEKIQALFRALEKNTQNYDRDKILSAINIAAQVHEGQVRASGEPYITHPLIVAEIIAEMNLDTDSIITAILHDTVEDTDLTSQDIEQIFGRNIANLVGGVTKLTRLEFKSDQMHQAENFHKLLLAMSEDIRALLVKLADRLHNMRTIHSLQKETKRQKIALETMEIYAPLAERIGMHNFKTELQDTAFEVLYPNVRESILGRLNEIAQDGAALINKIILQLRNLLEESGIEVEVMGRQKTPYSIWMKMNQKNVGFDQLSDIIAFRVVVKTLQDCYTTLGIIHSKYKMVPENFQDFISTPKNNGYQSIHTIVIGPFQQRIEIQIRTHEMHQIAELGVAAHWKYKQQYSSAAPEGKQFRWMRELLSILEQTSDPEEFISNTKLEMYYDQVFCFTPKGKLVALPKGASTIDFAYGIHSEVGSHCVGAKVNGQLVPLKTILKNGDQVEIVTSKNQVPNKSWEAYVVTARAKSEIRKFLRQQTIEQFACLGKDMLEKAFKSAMIDMKTIDLGLAIKKFAKSNLQDLLCAIGDGNVDREEVVKIYKPKPTIVDAFSLFKFNKSPAKQEAVSIKGLVQGMAINYAGCCHPIPGDSIVGIIHTGKGVTIHAAECEYLEHLKANEFDPIPLEWDRESTQVFVARVCAKIINEPGGMASISSEFAKEKCNIVNFKILNRCADFFDVIVDVEVESATYLNNVISILRAKKEIIEISRMKG